MQSECVLQENFISFFEESECEFEEDMPVDSSIDEGDDSEDMQTRDAGM